MNMWKTAALAAALVGAAGAGAAVSPAADAQTAVHVAPRSAQVVNLFGGSQIGVSIEDVDPADTKAAQAGGVLIEEVTADSPAEQAGLRKGDVVVEFDGERVRSARQFTRLVQETVPGRKVQTIVLRDGQRTTLTIEPRENTGTRFFNFDDGRALEELGRIARVPPVPARPGSPRSAFPDVESLIWRSGNTLGITTGDLSPQLAEYFGTKDGVLVTSVYADSAASKAGLKAGDVITSFNGTTVGTPAELRRSIQRLTSGDDFTIEVVRDKKSMTLKGKTEERRDRRRSTTRTIL
jgi:serine protease Do